MATSPTRSTRTDEFWNRLTIGVAVDVRVGVMVRDEVGVAVEVGRDVGVDVVVGRDVGVLDGDPPSDTDDDGDGVLDSETGELVTVADIDDVLDFVEVADAVEVADGMGSGMTMTARYAVDAAAVESSV